MIRRYGIIGYPLNYTLSPRMHNAAFLHLGLTAVYESYPVRDVSEGVKLIKEIPLLGVSVTIPHKEGIIPFLDDLSDEAREIGAVNTVANEDGMLVGFNTDWEGFSRALEEVVDMKGKEFLILGAGGAARAAAFAVKEKGGSFTVCSRTIRRAERIGADFGGRVIPWERRGIWEGDVIVNATPLGSKGEMPLPPYTIKPEMVVMDMVYSPRKTPLVREAERRGAKVVEGLRMLLFQGVRQFELWFKVKAPVDVMWKALIEG